ncbi:hypothetical protein F2Q69_00014691 [Brassica cretica]|uniref:Uncharacterized protein n=1 Tax=Brassica cretica TaxID=69181 RepID=A0A8S9QMM6_BRACR|nr:hypothetical protein F2Q69_00014691 [Brassica cretica]
MSISKTYHYPPIPSTAAGAGGSGVGFLTSGCSAGEGFVVGDISATFGVSMRISNQWVLRWRGVCRRRHLSYFWSLNEIPFCVDVDQFFISVVRWSLVVFVLGDGSRAMAHMSYGARFCSGSCGCGLWLYPLVSGGFQISSMTFGHSGFWYTIPSHHGFLQSYPRV